MQFIRQNMFYVVLIALVVVTAGALVFLNMSVSGKVDGREEVRGRASRDVQNAGTGQPVNPTILANRRKFLDTLRGGAKGVVDSCVDWNRRNLVDPNHMISAVGDGKPVTAFPIDPNQYDKLAYNFSNDYLGKLVALIKTISPTSPPTDDEIKVKADQIARILAASAPASAPAREGAAPAVEDAVTKATEYLKAQKAAEGLIYADASVLDRYFDKPETLISKKKMWEAQVNLWVLSDVLAAVNATNKQSLLGGGSLARERSVVNAAVKRLVKIDVTEQYFTTHGAMARSGGVSGAVMNLTQRTSTAEYDVIHYNLTVIMPFRYLPLLERKLMEQNFHTVLKVDIAEAPEAATGRYYYGADPVFQVTIHGEMLLLAAWERGTWEDGKWKYPPLMPVEVIDELRKEGVPVADAGPR